jgi:hypothetical protein
MPPDADTFTDPVLPPLHFTGVTVLVSTTAEGWVIVWLVPAEVQVLASTTT